MFLKALCLVALATVVSAGVGGKPTVTAVAKGTKTKIEDGFRIDLDGSESERQCANARWEVKVGGVYVKVADRMYAKYTVSEKAKTYKFRLTIWDPETPERTDVDYYNVDINGGYNNGGGGGGGDSNNGGDSNDGGDSSDSSSSKSSLSVDKSKNSKLFADADIIKVEETKNGYEIRLTGEDSRNCDDYVWEYKSKDGYVAIATKEKTRYEVFGEGKHKFRLICVDDETDKVDIDTTYVKIFDCKGPKYPSGDDNKGNDDGGNGGGSGDNSGGNSGGYNNGGDGGNDDNCKNSNKKHCDPCKGVRCNAKAAVKNVEDKGDKYIITLTAENSVDCKKFEWERLRGGNSENEYVGEGSVVKYTTTRKGEYRFRVSCTNNRCNDSDKDIVETDCVRTYK